MWCAPAAPRLAPSPHNCVAQDLSGVGPAETKTLGMNPRTSSSSSRARGGAAQRTVLRSAAVLAPVVQQQRQRNPESQPFEQTIGHAHGTLPRQARQAPLVQGPWNAAAEVHMDELERLSRQLLQNLQELNSATDAGEDCLPVSVQPRGAPSHGEWRAPALMHEFLHLDFKQPDLSPADSCAACQIPPPCGEQTCKGN